MPNTAKLAFRFGKSMGHRNQSSASGLSLFSLSGVCAVASAAFAMAATMPGRTHILGLITVGVLADFKTLSDPDYAALNLSVTLISAFFCFPCGWLIDRIGVKHLGPGLMLLLACGVIAMSHVQSVWQLGAALTITRGIGQSMLSIVSLAIIGKSFPNRNGPTMGAYAVVMTMFMLVGTVALQMAVAESGWRSAWFQLGTWLLIAAPIMWLLTPKSIDAVPLPSPADFAAETSSPTANMSHATYWQALATPCFWTFSISIALFGLITTGFTLFQEKIFAEQNLSREVYYAVQIIGLGVGLLTNLACGGLARVVRLEILLAAAMAILAGALAWLPWVNTPSLAYGFGVVYAVAGGMLSVLFFAVWGHAFGTLQLGRIQAAAQFLTVLASAVGPLVIAMSRAQAGSYHPVLWLFGGVCLLLSITSLFAPVPSAARGDWDKALRVAEPAPTMNT